MASRPGAAGGGPRGWRNPVRPAGGSGEGRPDQSRRHRGGFDDGIVFQMISRVTVLDKERLCVRFKDGTEIEQTVEHMERRDTA